MVRQAFQIVYKEIRGLHHAAYVLALFTISSQALALLRDRLLAHQFGASSELDLYYAAFRIPDLLYVLFASALSVYVLIPFVSARIESGSLKRAQDLLSAVYTIFLITYSVLALTIGILAPYIIPVLFPGFGAENTILVLLTRILLLQPLFLGISSLFGVVTQLRNRFILYAISPLIYNLGIIAGIVFLYPLLGLQGIAFGVVLGAVGHIAIQIPFVAVSGLAPKITFAFTWADIRGVLRTSVPRSLTLSLHQIVLLVLAGFASIMATGSISVFQFGFNLQAVPLAIIGVSYSVASFPTLARLYAEKKTDAFQTYLVTALRHIIFWVLPLCAVIIVVRAQFVRVVLGSGAFNWDDTRLTAAILALFSISLVSQAINLLIVRALYAVGNTRIPFFVTLGSSVSILVFAYLLSALYVVFPPFAHSLESLMRVGDVPGTEVLVLALAYTIGLLLHSVVIILFSSRVLSFSPKAIVGDLTRAVLAALVAGAISYATLNFFVDGLKTETLLGILLQGAFASILGIAGAALAYYLQGSEEFSEIYHSLHRRVFKTNMVAPQDEDHFAM